VHLREALAEGVVVRNYVRVGIAVAVVVAIAAPAGSVLVPGGRNPRTDCYARFKINEGVDLLSTRVVRCTDNDPSCDLNPALGSCGFKVAACINQTDNMPTCIPPGPAAPLKAVRPKGRVKRLGLVPPADLASSTCGPSIDVAVNLRGRKRQKRGNLKLVMRTISPVKPRKDVDKVRLICNPCTGANCESVTTTTTLPAPLCGPNPDGGPDEAFLATADDGTDLDNGWTGVAHNFPVDPRASIRLCLSGCDGTTNPVCDASGATGAGSINGTTFGPPLPLVANLVPVCVVNNYQPGPVTARFNVQTGDVLPDAPLSVNLFSDTHFTSPDNVCPSCTGPNANTYGDPGTCNSGQNQGQACTIESILDVVQPGNTRTYRLSSACPPSRGDFAGRLNINLRLTTGTSSLMGPTPCVRQPGEPAGVTVQDDSCHGTPCSAACTGNACVRRNANNECVDSKGGIAQVCCSDNPASPCFPTANGGVITRTGRADPPRASNGLTWPDLTYPKVSHDGILVATFCEGATGTGTINGSTGLPGPGALILPGLQALLKQ
jgi:hypothetical protein